MGLPGLFSSSQRVRGVMASATRCQSMRYAGGSSGLRLRPQRALALLERLRALFDLFGDLSRDDGLDVAVGMHWLSSFELSGRPSYVVAGGLRTRFRPRLPGCGARVVKRGLPGAARLE